MKDPTAPETVRCLWIAMSPRSGSTLLSQSLETSGATGEVIEFFHEKVFPAQCARFNIPPETPYHQKVMRLMVSAARNGVFTCKIAYEQFEDLIHGLKQSEAVNPQQSTSDLFLRHFPNSTWIYLERKDLWAQAISLDRANRSNNWIAIEGNTERTQYVPEFNYPELLRNYRYLLKCQEQWQTIFADLTVTPAIHLSYEDFLQKREHWINRILETVDLVDKISSRNHPTPVRKMGDHINKQWRERVAEIDTKEHKNGISSFNFRELRADWKVLEFPSPVIQHSDVFLTLQLTNLSERIWHAEAGAGLTGWLQILACWMEADGVTPMPHKHTYATLPRDLMPGESIELKMLLEVPAKSGPCTLQLNVIQIQNEKDEWEIGHAGKIPVEILPPPWLATYEARFGPCKIIAPEILWCDWYGYFRISEYPWLFQSEQGWWLFDNDVPEDADGCFFQDSILGPVWTRKGVYPSILCFRNHQWVTFLGLTENKVRCFKVNDQPATLLFAARSHEDRIDE